MIDYLSRLPATFLASSLRLSSFTGPDRTKGKAYQTQKILYGQNRTDEVSHLNKQLGGRISRKRDSQRTVRSSQIDKIKRMGESQP
jgi:hypothetical protein